jgi:hypothetical protein
MDLVFWVTIVGDSLRNHTKTNRLPGLWCQLVITKRTQLCNTPTATSFLFKEKISAFKKAPRLDTATGDTGISSKQKPN